MKYLSSLKNKDFSQKTCLLRVDFNLTDDDLKKQKVPLRIQAVLPTIKFLLEKRAKMVILSHRGRPDSKSYKLKAKSYTLGPFAKILSSLLKKPVRFITLKELGLINKTKKKIRNSAKGSIFLLENLRFFPGEDKNDQKFAKNLASLGDFYVNDAFAFSHRPTASIAGIPKFLPSYAGLLLEKEIKNLSKVMKKPKQPLVIILGGAKISDKIGVIKNFLKKVKGQRSKVSCFLTGGGVANTFLMAQAVPIGDSLYEKEMLPIAQQLLKSKKIVLPIDTVVSKRKILDIGPKTVKKYAEIIKNAKTIIWNGPMGYIENPKFAKGTQAIIQVINKSRAFSIIGGGETTTAFQAATRINADQYADKRGYISVNLRRNQRKSASVFLSTGGGAMLEYLAGKKLPGIAALDKSRASLAVGGKH